MPSIEIMNEGATKGAKESQVQVFGCIVMLIEETWETSVFSSMFVRNGRSIPSRGKMGAEGAVHS